jgi:hypothetical protein
MSQSSYPIPPPPGQQYSPYPTSYGPASSVSIGAPGAQDVKPGATAPTPADALNDDATLAYSMLPIVSGPPGQQIPLAQQSPFDAQGNVATGLGIMNGSVNGMVLTPGVSRQEHGTAINSTGQPLQLPPGSAYVSHKHNRLRKACDACSVRKVKVG